MAVLDDIRRSGEHRLAASLRALDREHRERVLSALERYGSVDAVPEAVWRSIERDIEEETVAAILMLILASDENTVQQLRRQGVHADSASASATVAYANTAAERAQRLAQETTATLRTRLAAKLSPAAAAAPPSVSVAVGEVFTPARTERIAKTTVVNSTSAGQLEAARRVVGGDGATTNTAGQTVRVELLWITTKRQNVCPRCAPLHGKPESVWGLVFPSGPGDEAHPNCACHLDPQVVVVSEAAA